MELDRYLLNLLKKKQKDFLTLRSIRDGLPVGLAKQLELEKGKSTLDFVKRQISPLLGEQIKIFEGRRTSYLGLNLSIEEMIMRKLQQKSDLSSKQLRNQLPYKNADFMNGINKLLKSSQISCELHLKTHLPKSFTILQSPAKPLKDSISEDVATFKSAFQTVGNGRQFVRIHEIRSYLNWSKTRFDSTLEKLKSELVIQLQGGDPLLLTKEELENSYTDPKGRVRITVNWIK